VGDLAAHGLERLLLHAEAVVLAGDLDLLGDLVPDRVVRAVVAELELVGLRPQREPEDLVAQADPEDRHLLLEADPSRSRSCT
jgi:hypothetical protein